MVKRRQPQKRARSMFPPANRADTRQQPKPSREKDENEDRREEPKGFLHQFRADDSFEKSVEPLDQKLPKVLQAGGYLLNVPGREPGKGDQPKRDDPGDEHRVGDETVVFTQLDRV